jgi:transposase InsO family protein
MHRIKCDKHHNVSAQQASLNRVARKPKGFKSSYPGQCVSMDTIERRMGTLKRYVMIFIDPNTSFAFAAAVTHNNSTFAKEVFTCAHRCYPFPIQTVLSDNGSEFKGAFSQLLDEADIEHWHTYPKTPKMNAHCERFNRTIQEDFIDYHEDLLFTDIAAFNRKLADWLVWYNKDRPHYAQGQLSPVQTMINFQPKCNMYWTHTGVRH